MFCLDFENFQQQSSRSDLAIRGHRVRSTKTRGSFCCLASCISYRHIALFLKSALIFSLNSNSYASSGRVEFQVLNNVNRIRGPLKPLPIVETGTTTERGGACGPQRTRDLRLQFEKDPGDWMVGVEEAKKVLGKKSAEGIPCEISAQPWGASGTEIILSYPAKTNPRDTLRALVFKTSDRLVVDHWVARPQSKKAKTNSSGSKEVPPSGSGAKGDQSPLKMSGTLLDVFEDQTEWDKVLGSKVVAFDLNSPELDRFRWPQADPELGISTEPIERRKLSLPYLDFPSLDQTLEFEEKKFSFKQKFLETDLDLETQKKLQTDPKSLDALMQGMNFLLFLSQDNDWLRAQKSLEILEKSQVKNHLPKDNARWWALKGLIYIKLSFKTGQKEFRTQGLEIWRTGIRRLTGRGGPQTEFIEFMLLESVRYLMDDQVTYAAAAIISWAQSFSWSQEVEERFGYLLGEIYFQLGLYNEAFSSFDKFYQFRSGKPLNASLDRRLVPASAFRLGDIMFRQNKFLEARNEYTRALSQLSTMSKFAFEGSWYPEEVARFPHVFFNRSEAALRLGFEQQALKDLRAFVFISPNHPKIGLVLFRIGEILHELKAPEEMVMNAWRECVFRVPETLGAKLCNARRSMNELRTTAKDGWPRLIGIVEEALPQGEKKFWDSLWPDDLEVYVNLILADAFIRLDEPRQALHRMESVKNREPSAYLKAWMHEYLVASFAGDLERNYQRGEFKEIISRYEPRKRDLFLHQTRPEVLWRVAKAFEGLNLFPEADKVLSLAENVKETIGRSIPRPYDPVPEDWLQFRARVNIGLFKLDPSKKPKALESLENLNQKLVTTQRLWVDFGIHAKEPKIQARAWRALEAIDPLTWKDLELYVRALEETREFKEKAQLLEGTVGVWFGEVGRPRVDSRGSEVPTNLLMLLADDRLKDSKNSAGALAVLEFLRTLDVKDLGNTVTKPMIEYKKGIALKNLGRIDDARQSFVSSRTLDPESVWGKLSSSAEKDLISTSPSNSQLR